MTLGAASSGAIALTSIDRPTGGAEKVPAQGDPSVNKIHLALRRGTGY